MAKRSKRIVTPANDLLARAGVRYKPSAAAMLALLLEQPELALTHTEFEQALAQRGVCVNRVTLYRWLERLVAAEVLEKRSDDVDRTWRFSLRSAQPGMSLLRFECDACRRHFNLPEASCRIPYDHMVACETGAGGSGTNLSWPASAYCS